MTRILAHIETQPKDFYHSVGQALVRPVSLLFGKSYEEIREIPNGTTTQRVVMAALSILLLPGTVLTFAVGTLLLQFSQTHARAYERIQESEIRIVWDRGLPEIHSERLTLRPVNLTDLPTYQALFKNPVAMEKYAGGVRDITQRFLGWCARWNEHSFSALAVVENTTENVIGHVVAGHGDYEGNFEKGWSEMAVVIDPAYWNADHVNLEKGIGTAGLKNIGSEVVRATVAYARALNKLEIPVPSDVTPEQRPEIEKNPTVKTHRNEKGDIDWVYLPFTELRATAHKENAAGHRILEEVFVRENGAVKSVKNAERDLFVVNF